MSLEKERVSEFSEPIRRRLSLLGISGNRVVASINGPFPFEKETGQRSLTPARCRPGEGDRYQPAPVKYQIAAPNV